MKKLKILDFDGGCGGLTTGFENSKKYNVVGNLSLNENNNYCYNKVHDSDFEIDEDLTDDYDLVTFTPHLANSFFRKTSADIDFSELYNHLMFVSLKKPDNLIFVTKREAFEYLQISDEICFINNNTFPVRDIISNHLVASGYSVLNFIIDYAGYGLPQHNFYNIYIASLNDISSFSIKEYFGTKLKEYRTPKDFLSSINDDSNLTWHNPDYTKEDICSKIKPGDNARKTSSVSQRNGYERLYPDRVSTHLSNDFYTVSSYFPSIHPWYNRPLTIREGARLFGLYDSFDWPTEFSKKQVGMMIYNSFSPMVSRILALALYGYFK